MHSTPLFGRKSIEPVLFEYLTCCYPKTGDALCRCGYATVRIFALVRLNSRAIHQLFIAIYNDGKNLLRNLGQVL